MNPVALAPNFIDAQFHKPPIFPFRRQESLVGNNGCIKCFQNSRMATAFAFCVDAGMIKIILHGGGNSKLGVKPLWLGEQEGEL